MSAAETKGMLAVTVRLFAVAAETVGVKEQVLSLPAGARIADAEAALLAGRPELANILTTTAFARNRRYARRDEPLADGDELAVLPPVSGG